MKFRKTLSTTATLLLIFATVTDSSFAATKTVPKQIKVVAARPNLVTNLSAAAGDQISAILTTSTAVAYVGTMESSTVAPYTAQQIGGTDGFIAVIDATGAPIWDLRLGTAQDDIATAVARDRGARLHDLRPAYADRALRGRARLKVGGRGLAGRWQGSLVPRSH